MTGRSLQVRLAATLSFGLAAIWLIASWAVVQALRHELDEVFDSAIQETAQRILPLAVMEVIDRGEGPTQRLATVRRHEEILSYVVRDPAGTVVLQSHDADPGDFPAQVSAGFTSTATHRLYAESALRGTLTIVMAEPLRIREEAVRKAAGALGMPLIALVPLSLVGTWWVVALGMRPVRRLCDAIERRGTGDLSPLAAGDLPAEIEPIARSVDQLMDRLRRALDAERNFAAKSAHELRTPIAAALAQTQRLLAETTVPATRERASQVEGTLKALARLAEKLMQLVRAEGGRLTIAEASDIVPVVRLACEDAARATGLGARLELDLPARPVLSTIDPDAAAILLRNLVENAARHGAPDVPVTVSLTRDGRLRVVNGGPSVPPDLLPDLVRPFARGTARVPGAGLGLAIADAIARGAGSRLELRSPAAGHDDGFEASVALAT